MKRGLLIVALAVLVIALPCEARRVINGYSVKMLAQYFSGTAFSRVGLNDAGTLATGMYATMADGSNGLQAVFVPFRKRQTILWLPELGSNYAIDINNGGVILGQYTSGSYMYDTKSHMVNTIPGYFPVALNNTGGVLLNAIDGSGPVVIKNGTTVPIDVAPIDINDADEIVGKFEDDVFIATQDGWDEWLGSGWSPYAINNNRIVVGFTANNWIFRAVRYVKGELTNIPVMGDPTHGGPSRAFDINNAGVVVGEVSNRAAVDRGQGFEDLNTLASIPTGWRLTEAIKINTSGQIVCYGVRPRWPDNSLYRVFLLTPKRW